MKREKKYFLYLGIVILILLLIVGYFRLKGKSNNKTSSLVIPTEEVVPTIDDSVKVDLQSLVAGKEIILIIENIPFGTEIIDYELSYQTKDQGLQGIIGTINLSGEKNYQKKLTLGTCSSGSCVYHQVIGKIKLTLKFSGSYGERIFEKDYSL